MSEQLVVSNKLIPVPLQAMWPPILLAGLSVPVAGGAFFLSPGVAGLALWGAAASIFLVAVVTGLLDAMSARKNSRLLAHAGALIGDDPAPCLCADADGTIIAQNQAAETLFGRVRGEGITDRLSAVLINAAAVVARQQDRVAAQGHSFETVFTREGYRRLTTHKLGSGTIWRFDDGGLADGVSPRDDMSLAMLVAAQDGTIQSMNGKMHAVLGQPARTVAAVFGTDEIQSGGRTCLETVEGPVGATAFEVPRADGQREIYAYDFGEHFGDSDRTQTLFERLPVAALLIDSDGRVQSQNEAARQLLQTGDDEEPLKIGDLIDGPGRLARDWMRDILEGRIPNHPEIVRMHSKASERSLKVNVSPLPGTSEPRLLAVLQDATEVQDLHTQFAQSQKMQAIGELAGGVAHDFNNLLTAITGHCDLLLLRHDQGDQDYADLVQIHQNANRAASLVGQLLAFSRKQTMDPELLDLRDTMAELTHLLNRLLGERVRLELNQESALQPIWADRRLLDQVLMNLVVNARDAMPDGGLVRIVSRMARLEKGLQRNNAHVPSGTYVIIEVSDEGVGIPAARLGRIFEPFFTTKKVGEGTGLGLSMAYGIMKQSGGYIFCDSTPGEGTTFSLVFPAHDWPAEQGAVPAKDAKPDPVRGQARNDSGVILLVEDEAPVRAFASRALRLKGYSVLEAENGEEALDVLQDEELEIDVFVTDMIMPGMGGPDWVRRALVTRPDVGIVFTSGYAEDAYGRFPDIPQAVFLAKPFSLADLTDIVQQQLN